MDNNQILEGKILIIIRLNNQRFNNNNPYGNNNQYNFNQGYMVKYKLI